MAKSILALSVASYISLYPVLLAPPLALLAHGCRVRDTHVVRSANGFLIRYCLAIAGTISGLLLVSYSILGSSWAFLVSTYGVQLTLSDLSPNVGLWWYFFVEMFDSFRNFFLGVFWLHITSYVGAMTIRLRCVDVRCLSHPSKLTLVQKATSRCDNRPPRRLHGFQTIP